MTGLYSVLQKGKDCKHFLGIVQGTNNPAFRGVIVGARKQQHKLVVRYDATLQYEYKLSFIRRIRKRILLPILFSQITYLSYTGKWAREYLQYYGANERQLFWFPYSVDHNLMIENSSKARFQRQQLRHEMGINKNSLVYLVVAKFSPREAPQDVIRAFQMLNTKNSTLIVVGDGPQRNEIHTISNDSGQGLILFPGYVSYSQLPLYYAIADVFIHPAHNECWGVSVNEAMVCGLPVIAADTVGSATDLVENGINGFIYPHGQIEILCDKMRFFLINQKKLSKMGRKSKSIIKKWGVRETAQRLVDWASEIL
ncbi:D-inositol-3-phosphate glycosyltransferase [subsurface metagenome]